MNTYIAKTLFGLENILASELQELGAKKIEVLNRAVSFQADLYAFYKINLASRVAIRIIKPIKTFYAATPEALYKNAKKISWQNYINLKNTFAVTDSVNSSTFTHSKYAVLKLKDSIADYFREKFGKRPDVDIKNPNVRINLHIDKNKVNISIDSSGESLHKRGYRLDGEIAPLNEILASGMILLSDWDKRTNFIDPMCGSGTIAIEAALMALNIAPNINREKFAFMYWKNFDRKIFESVKKELNSKRKNFSKVIIANDINQSSLLSAKENAKRAGVDSIISFSNKDLFKMQNNLEEGIIITNPPYGERLKQEKIDDFYKNIGNTLKKNYNNFSAWILSSNKNAFKKLGLRTSRKIQLFNGSLECKLHKYELYQGSKKRKHRNRE
ncbi:MAG: RNA methyltransferase [Ignavibacteriae bacterium]|nr:MAG: RNA methyltransferase [Ignavibacteriota bacterium]